MDQTAGIEPKKYALHLGIRVCRTPSSELIDPLPLHLNILTKKGSHGFTRKGWASNPRLHDQATFLISCTNTVRVESPCHPRLLLALIKNLEPGSTTEMLLAYH